MFGPMTASSHFPWPLAAFECQLSGGSGSPCSQGWPCPTPPPRTNLDKLVRWVRSILSLPCLWGPRPRAWGVRGCLNLGSAVSCSETLSKSHHILQLCSRNQLKKQTLSPGMNTCLLDGQGREPPLPTAVLFRPPLPIPRLLAQECARCLRRLNTPSELPPEGSGPKSGCFRRKNGGCLSQGSSCGEARALRSSQEETTDRARIRMPRQTTRFLGLWVIPGQYGTIWSHFL